MRVSSLATHLAGAALLSFCASTQARSDDNSGWYISAIGGLTSQSNQTLDLEDFSDTSARLKLGNGFLAGASLGYQFPNQWQVEGEVVYQTVDVNGLVPEIFGTFDEGNFASLSAALNARYTLSLFGSERVRSYFGAGLVYLSEVDIDFERPGVERSFSGDDFGFQVMFGARYHLGERFYVESGVRYLLASSLDLDGEDGATGRIKADYSPFAITAAVGWRF